MNKHIVQANEIIKFWFEEIEDRFWWVKDTEFDQSIADRFKTTHAIAIQGKLSSWRKTPLGRLAEIIVLDQFSRNLYRDSPLAFAYDEQALFLSQTAIRIEADQFLNNKQKTFLYMPFMHSESPATHKIAIKLYAAPGLKSNYDFELKHKAIIDRFGRYPHRNKTLGRQSTAEEIDFLQEPNSSF